MCDNCQNSEHEYDSTEIHDASRRDPRWEEIEAYITKVELSAFAEPVHVIYFIVSHDKVSVIRNYVMVKDAFETPHLYKAVLDHMVEQMDEYLEEVSPDVSGS